MPDETFDETLGAILEPGEEVVYDSDDHGPSKESHKKRLVLFTVLGGPLFIVLFGLKLAVTICVPALCIGLVSYFQAYRTRTVLTSQRVTYADRRRKTLSSWSFGQIDRITRLGNETAARLIVHLANGEQGHVPHLPNPRPFWDALPPGLRDPGSDELTRKHRALTATYALFLVASMIPLYLVASLLPIHIFQSLGLCGREVPGTLFYPALVGAFPVSFFVGSILSGFGSTLIHKRRMSREEARMALTNGFNGAEESILGRLIEWSIARPLAWTVDCVYGRPASGTGRDRQNDRSRTQSADIRSEFGS